VRAARKKSPAAKDAKSWGKLSASGTTVTRREYRILEHSEMEGSRAPRHAPPSPPVTDLLLAWGRGDESALEQLVPLVHAELHRLARRQMRGERNDHTLQTTALVNEAYLRLIDLSRVRWQDRAHFFATSARVMRRILVDHARSRQFAKRGGGARKIPFDEALVPVERSVDLVALDDALRALADIDARKSQVVEMRFFAGLSVEEAAAALGISPETVMRDWRVAKAWLLRELRSHD
jgi:RNA polymerase sigma-70 factor, ECF subfamily